MLAKSPRLGEAGKNRSGDLGFKRNNLSCNDIRSHIVNCSKRGHQDSESKGSKHAGIQIVSLEMVSRFVENLVNSNLFLHYLHFSSLRCKHGHHKACITLVQINSKTFDPW